MAVIKITDLDLAGKRVLIREDLNVPVNNGTLGDDTRLRASLPNIELALKAGGRVMVMSHLGRPQEGVLTEADSLRPLTDYFSRHFGKPVRLIADWVNGGFEVAPGELVLLENVRVNKGEKKNSEELARKMAALCDVYVNDAFASAHRAEASTHGVAKFAPVACAGLLLIAELEALDKALENPARPLVAIVGGAKVSTKLSALKSLAEKVDQLIVGGGIADMFLLAEGHNIGKSLAEPMLLPDTKEVIARIRAKGGAVPIPVDVVCAKEFSESAQPLLKNVAEVADDDLILDIGPKSSKALTEVIARAGTVVWNGPLGVFEFDQFSAGTRALANAVAQSKAFSIAGGGETLAAVAKFGVADRISYLCTGGGAFLEYLEGKKLPAVEILEQRAQGRT